MEYWLRLAFEPNVGPVTARHLLSALKTPEAIFSSGYSILTTFVGLELAKQLSSPPSGAIIRAIDQAMNWQTQKNCHLLTLSHKSYPYHLKTTYDPPVILYAKGQLAALQAPTLAIVGARNASPQGLENAHGFAYHLSQQGFSIVSGLAHGIDAAAHQGALDANGQTIAVMGTGMDIIYPKQHTMLAKTISETGLILSEFALGTKSYGFNFPRRNRIVAGLSMGILIVEAALKSGSLITARYALDMGREVFAIPGSIHSPLSKGCHLLIKQGAALIENVSDVASALGIQHSPSPPEFEPSQDPLLDIIGFDPIAIDELLALSDLSLTKLTTLLFELEISGQIARLPGGMVQRKVTLTMS